jgi:hypothetical protein
METIKINKETVLIFKEIRSIKKPKSINPLLEKLEKHFQNQLESLDVRINLLKEENKRLNRL